MRAVRLGSMASRLKCRVELTVSGAAATRLLITERDAAKLLGNAITAYGPSATSACRFRYQVSASSDSVIPA